MAGPGTRDLLHKAIAPPFDELLRSRRSFVTDQNATLLVCKDPPAAALAAFPVVSVGDIMGGVALIKGEKSPPKLSAESVESVKAAAMFLSRQLET